MSGKVAYAISDLKRVEIYYLAMGDYQRAKLINKLIHELQGECGPLCQIHGDEKDTNYDRTSA